MSDRASAQKSFNNLLTEYRTNTLPIVFKNWETLTEMEKSSMCEMYHFYCGMHLVVNMAEHTAEALKLFEIADGAVDTDREAGTVRLVRTVCKAFQRRGCEKSGCPLQFTTYLKSQGIDINPLIHFKGNRFNILFANGGRVYYLQKHIINFLTKTWGTPNRLLKAVLDDAQSDVYIAGCKALGLVDKLITGPLWHILESNIHILEVPKHIATLLSFVKYDDISTFVTGERVPFPGIAIKKDAIWASLVLPSHLDSLVEQILHACFKSIEVLLERALADLEQAQDADASVTTSVPTTNTVSERDFAKLDRLLREKPHASTLALEAHILFTNNKTTNWFASKTQEEQEMLMQTVRKMCVKHKKAFRDRLKVLEEKRTQAQLECER